MAISPAAANAAIGTIARWRAVKVSEALGELIPVFVMFDAPSFVDGRLGVETRLTTKANAEV
ncbi:hypothetical protein NK8_63580 (plasmid) [Caballeronia sp. NK8]|nr:hypothetical protein NK8_63580 [Caballeronia sp. NK8]